MSNRTCRVGVHGRNHEQFAEQDFEVIRNAGLEVVKMMSQTEPWVFERITNENLGLEIITRLHDDRIKHGHPTPAEFADKMIPIMKDLWPYCKKFHIANEPNHVHRYEGWGAEDEDARSFNQWFLEAYDRLKNAFPEARIGFPGLAVPHYGHRDRAWLEICREAVLRADWLGVHCYWQTPPGQKSMVLHEDFGLTFEYYHQRFPNKTLEILECGNSNIQNNYPIKDEDVAREYVGWLQEVFKHDYINSASFFILSSQDTGNWKFFSWRTENNWVKPVVQWIAQMDRPELVAGPVVSAMTRPRYVLEIEPGQYTNQHVITAMNKAAAGLGLGDWDLMGKAGLKLSDLAAARQAAYTGPAMDQLPNLTRPESALIKHELAVATGQVQPSEISFSIPGDEIDFLWQQTDLANVSLAWPSSQHISLAETGNSLEAQVARTWNRYGWLLLTLAEFLKIEPAIAVAVLASQGDQRGFARDGQMTIRFEPHIFFEQWGKANPGQYQQHFRFHPNQPWQKHQWRSSTNEAWRDLHGKQSSEWAAFELARNLDETAAKLSLGIGFPRMMGFNYVTLGYESVGQMFDAYASSERYHLLGFFDFISGPGAYSRQLSALQEQNLDLYAALHYGSSQAARYSSLLSRTLKAVRKLKPDLF